MRVTSLELHQRLGQTINLARLESVTVTKHPWPYPTTGDHSFFCLVIPARDLWSDSAMDIMRRLLRLDRAHGAVQPEISIEAFCDEHTGLPKWL